MSIFVSAFEVVIPECRSSFSFGEDNEDAETEDTFEETPTASPEDA